MFENPAGHRQFAEAKAISNSWKRQVLHVANTVLFGLHLTSQQGPLRLRRNPDPHRPEKERLCQEPGLRVFLFLVLQLSLPNFGRGLEASVYGADKRSAALLQLCGTTASKLGCINCHSSLLHQFTAHRRCWGSCVSQAFWQIDAKSASRSALQFPACVAHRHVPQLMETGTLISRFSLKTQKQVTEHAGRNEKAVPMNPSIDGRPRGA